MLFRPFILLSVGMSILATAGAIAVQPSKSLHTIQGKLTATRPDTASAPCNQIAVRAELRETPEDLELPIRMLNLGSTKAQGTTLSNGCSYTLTFNLVPKDQMGELSNYYLVAETPVMDSRSAAQYRPIGRLPMRYDLKF